MSNWKVGGRIEDHYNVCRRCERSRRGTIGLHESSQARVLCHHQLSVACVDDPHRCCSASFHIHRSLVFDHTECSWLAFIVPRSLLQYRCRQNHFISEICQQPCGKCSFDFTLCPALGFFQFRKVELVLRQFYHRAMYILKWTWEKATGDRSLLGDLTMRKTKVSHWSAWQPPTLQVPRTGHRTCHSAFIVQDGSCAVVIAQDFFMINIASCDHSLNYALLTWPNHSHFSKAKHKNSGKVLPPMPGALRGTWNFNQSKYEQTHHCCQMPPPKPNKAGAEPTWGGTCYVGFPQLLIQTTLIQAANKSCY